jgi:hypothetical protein
MAKSDTDERTQKENEVRRETEISRSMVDRIEFPQEEENGE